MIDGCVCSVSERVGGSEGLLSAVLARGGCRGSARRGRKRGWRRMSGGGARFSQRVEDSLCAHAHVGVGVRLVLPRSCDGALLPRPHGGVVDLWQRLLLGVISRRLDALEHLDLAHAARFDDAVRRLWRRQAERCRMSQLKVWRARVRRIPRACEAPWGPHPCAARARARSSSCRT